MNIDWELAYSLTVDDGQGVRCVCELPPLLTNDDTSTANDDAYRLVVGTQGGAMYQWSLPSKSLTPIVYQHNNSVTAILASNDSNSSSSSSSNDVYVTGCKDAGVRIFDATTHELIKTLKGHDKPVTSLAWVETSKAVKYLVSGSWDGTAKVWDIQKGVVVATLTNHENSTCVCGLPAPSSDGTSSSDDDCILVATGSAGIAQGNQISNYSVRIWKITPTTGDQTLLHTVANDHQGPIRDISLSPDTGLLATCSNDGTVKLRTVETGECLETLSFPPIQDVPMLLSTGSCASGIMAAAEDGHVVFWTSAPDPQLIRHPSSVWLVHSLQTDGDVATCCQDGVLRIFTQSSERIAEEPVKQAFADAVQATLTKRGPTSDEVAKLPKWELNALQQGKSEGQVQLFQKDGTAIAAQWSAASRTWIEVGQVVGGPNNQEGGAGTIDGVKYDYVLPIEVDQTGGGVAKLEIGYNTGENHFVAAQRFIDAHMLPQHHHGEIANYIQQRVGSTAPTIGAAAAAPPAASAGVPLAAYEHLPAKACKIFDLGKATNFDKVLGKISEVGELSEEEMTTLKDMTDVLAATSRYHASKVDVAAQAVLVKMLSNWEPAQAFPALDLARLAILHPSTTASTWDWSKITTLAMTLCEKDMNGVAVPMLTLRLVANVLKEASTAVNLDQVLALTQPLISSRNKNIRLSVATVLLNMSLLTATVSPLIAAAIVTQTNAILDLHKTYESEAMVRAMLALGTVLFTSGNSGTKEVAKSLFLKSKVEMAASPHGDKAKSIAKELYALLQ